jgi:hypothetical protein
VPLGPSTHRQTWVRAALLVGLAYLLIGRWFPQPPGHLRAWRLAAWLASGGAFAAHIAYEHFGLRSSPRRLASHVALAVAIGAVALAGVGMMRSLSTTSMIHPRWLLALVIWPAVTAVPAFLAALLAGAVLTRLTRGTDAR